MGLAQSFVGMFLAIFPAVEASAATTTASALFTTSTSSYTSPTNFVNTIIVAHNMRCHQRNASDLSWNKTLANISSEHSTPCVFAHSHGKTGENPAAGYANTIAAVDAWEDEGKEYKFGSGNFSDLTGQFTQDL